MDIIESQANFNSNKKLLKQITQEINSEDGPIRNTVLNKEIQLLSYQIRNAKVSDSGSILSLSEEILSHLENRSQNTLNPRLKLRFNYLLWNSRRKNNANLKSINSISSEIINDADFDFQSEDNFHIIENYISIFYHSKEYSEKAYQYSTLYLTQDFKEIIPYQYELLRQLNQLKKFKFNKLLGIEDCLIRIFDLYIEKHHILIAENLLELALDISQKLRIDSKQWYNRTAQILEKHADVRTTDPQPSLSYKSYKKAQLYYEKAQNKVASESIESKINALDGRPLLSPVPGLGIPHSVLLEKLENATNEIRLVLRRDKVEIVDFLFGIRHRLPKLTPPQKTVADHLGIFSKFEFDLNGNIFDRANSRNLEFEPISLLVYAQEIESSIIPLIDRLIIDGYINGKFDYHSFTEEFANRSWLTDKMKFSTSDGKIISYEWINLIKPSIQIIFEALDDAISKSTTYENKIVLAIDSLSPKIEGLLREHLHVRGLPSTKKSRTEVQEKNLEDLIGDETILKIFDKKEITFIKYVLTRQGKNLRNNISHAFFRMKSQYHWHQVLLLILVLIIVSKKEST